MRNPDKKKEKIKVSWDENTIFHENTRHSKSGKSKAKNLNKLYKLLMLNLSSFGVEGIDQFFKDQQLQGPTLDYFFNKKVGTIFLALTIANNDFFKTLKCFLEEKVPDSYLRNALQEDNFYLLQDRLDRQSFLEKRAEYKGFAKQRQIDILKFFIHIDPEGVEHFIVANKDKEYMTPGVLAEYEYAKAEFEKEQAVSTVTTVSKSLG